MRREGETSLPLKILELLLLLLLWILLELLILLLSIPVIPSFCTRFSSSVPTTPTTIIHDASFKLKIYHLSFFYP
jgi:hypothetical protein